MITREAPEIVSSKVIGNILVGVDKAYKIHELARVAKPLTAAVVRSPQQMKPGPKKGFKAKTQPIQAPVESRPNGRGAVDLDLEEHAE